MSQRYIKKRKSQLTYIVHKDGKSRKVTKSFKRESPGISTDTDQRGETTANDDVIIDGVQIQVPEENARSLAALEEAPSCDQKKYEKTKYKRLENWAEVSKKLYQKGLQKQYLTGSTCNQCNIDTTDLYRCIDCINYHATCLPCLEKRHEFPHLHIFEKWMVTSKTIYESLLYYIPYIFWSLLPVHRGNQFTIDFRNSLSVSSKKRRSQ
ncbi:unnamed protein product [Mytilus coruscus]|uniref:Uncharacterized protein n=1 Tax=Mytilus coruscus TaxID=42192 RepID=A0A6J8EP61_MYTCO|nr:unnamed protein product [Mytilus coruscus]